MQIAMITPQGWTKEAAGTYALELPPQPAEAGTEFLEALRRDLLRRDPEDNTVPGAPEDAAEDESCPAD